MDKSPIDFALFVPHNEIVQLIGDFSDWKPLPMEKGRDGWWRASVATSRPETLRA